MRFLQVELPNYVSEYDMHEIFNGVEALVRGHVDSEHLDVVKIRVGTMYTSL